MKIRIPTGLTYSDIRPGLTRSSLLTLNQFLVRFGHKPVDVGDANPLSAWLNDLDVGGARIDRARSPSELATCHPISREEDIPIHYAELIVAIGGDVESRMVYFQIPDRTALVPPGFPNREFPIWRDSLPCEPEYKIHSWETWGLRQGGPDEFWREVSGKHFRTSQNRLNRGEPLAASIWVPAMDDGLNVVPRLPHEESPLR